MSRDKTDQMSVRTSVRCQHFQTLMGQTPAFRRTYFFVFLMQFGLRRTAAFVSSPIYLF